MRIIVVVRLLAFSPSVQCTSELQPCDRLSPAGKCVVLWSPRYLVRVDGGPQALRPSCVVCDVFWGTSCTSACMVQLYGGHFTTAQITFCQWPWTCWACLEVSRTLFHLRIRFNLYTGTPQLSFNGPAMSTFYLWSIFKSQSQSKHPHTCNSLTSVSSYR